MHFWKNVSTLIDRRGLSLRALARELDVSPTSLSNYARGAIPGLDAAARIADFFGVTVDALISENLDHPATVCPDPDEHRFLHELVDELGLNELRVLTRLGNQAPAWRLADILATNYPTTFTLDELRTRLNLEEPLLEASLLALRRRRSVVELTNGAEVRYRWREPVAQFQAREDGDVALHMKRAMQLFVHEVLPAIERRDGTGALITIVAKLPPETAQEMADKLKDMIESEGRKYTAEVGSRGIHLVFGVALEEEAHYTEQ